jgi:hypothetical protein
MDNRRIIVGVLSAATAVVALPSSATAEAGADTLTMSIDSFGRLALDDRDVGSYLSSEQVAEGEFYAGNNCVCHNTSCGTEPVKPTG